MTYRISKVPRYEIEISNSPTTTKTVALTFHQISHIVAAYVATRRSESIMSDLKSEWTATDHPEQGYYLEAFVPLSDEPFPASFYFYDMYDNPLALLEVPCDDLVPFITELASLMTDELDTNPLGDLKNDT